MATRAALVKVNLVGSFTTSAVREGGVPEEESGALELPALGLGSGPGLALDSEANFMRSCCHQEQGSHGKDISD